MRDDGGENLNYLKRAGKITEAEKLLCLVKVTMKTMQLISLDFPKNYSPQTLTSRSFGEQRKNLQK